MLKCWRSARAARGSRACTPQPPTHLWRLAAAEAPPPGAPVWAAAASCRPAALPGVPWCPLRSRHPPPAAGGRVTRGQ